MTTTREREEAAAVDAAHDAARTRQADAARGAHAIGQAGRYTAQPGDTYDSIADATGGSAEAIHAANAGGAASANPDLLEPGTVLIIPVPEPGHSGDDVALDSLTRSELNDRARAAGVEKPEDLPNKQAVIDAIEGAD